VSNQPSPHDLDAWRAAIWSEPDRGARQQLVRDWALALDAHEVTDPGRDPVLHLPHNVDPETAGVLAHYAHTNAVPLSVPR
jgi:hypothetical protein